LLQNLTKLLPGLLACVLLAAVAWWLSDLLKQQAQLLLEPLVIGIVLGIALSALGLNRPWLKPGVAFSARQVLELAIVLLGFKLSFARLAALGGPALLGVVLFVPLIVLAAVPLGRLFRLPPRLAVLIGVGSGICGSSAIAAVAPVIGAEEADAALAVSGLSVLGAGGVLLYAAINHALPLSDAQYGVWAGLSMQAVPNALAAAFARSAAAGDIGTIVKMARVALLAPLALGLALWFRPRPENAGLQARSPASGVPRPLSTDPAAQPSTEPADGLADDADRGLRTSGKPLAVQAAGPKTRAPRAPGVPLYVILFIAAGALNSTGWAPAAWSKACADASALLMIVAMSALGLGVDFASLRKRAGPAFTMSALLFLLVAASAYAWSLWVVQR
jgi:uncharacterized integral membrane protein (TIGR00698 family)